MYSRNDRSSTLDKQLKMESREEKVLRKEHWRRKSLREYQQWTNRLPVKGWEMMI